MKKIYTKIEYQFNKTSDRYEIVHDEHYWYEGPIAQAGGIMGGGGGEGGGSSSSVQKSEPWEPQQPYILAGLEEAKRLFLDTPPPQFYPGNPVTPFSPETETALQLQTLRSLTQSPIETSANRNLNSTLRGDFLYGNPGFNASIDAAARRIIPQVQSSFEKSGRTASGLQDQAIAQAIADPFALQYGQERENQLKAQYLAPSTVAQDYADFGKLAQVGNTREQRAQDILDNKVNRFNYNQNIMQQQIKDYMPLVSGNYGGTVTTNTTQSGGGSGGGSGLGGLGQALMFGGMGGGGGGGGLLGGLGFLGGLF